MVGKLLDDQAIFEVARRIDSHEARQAYLLQTCGEDLAMAQRIETLLLAHDESASFLECPPPGVSVSPTISQPLLETPGNVIGPYKLLQQIGEGGMGAVWMAEQTQPVQRKVALKVIKPGMDSRQVIARFAAERQALAMMDHVNIARVLDAGTTESGLPYFVMELVHGLPITKYCDDNHLTPRERLELFVPVCQAIQHAHQKGIIHRDIKPSNVMITLYDGKPVPKVIDFGVAKATEQTLTQRTLFTQYGTMVGTLEYMSPEQAEMSALGIDTRSDIFSLGVLLYELLTGSTPLTQKRLKEAAYAEILRLIKEEEPLKPSTRLSESGEALASISAQRHTEPAKLSKQMRGELDWIVMKTLEKDRNRRYETANGLAADVQRYLADEPVEACPPSPMYRFGKFAKRKKRAPATAALLGMMLLAAIGAVAGSVGWVMRDKAARLAKASDQIDDALRDASKLQEQQKWAEALAVVKQAQVLLSTGGDEDQCQRVHQRIADLELLVKLDDAGLSAAEVKDGHYDVDKGAAAYAKAFRDYGIDLEALVPAEAGALLRARSIGVEVAAALDSWVSMQRPNTRAWQALLTLARAADPDPFRDRARAAVARGDRKALRELAASDQIIDLPGPTLVLVARLVDDPGDVTQSVALLRKAQQRHPGDFWLNCHLARRLYELKPAQTDETVRFWSAALALRPKSPGVYVNLGLALFEKHSYDESIAADQQAIRLKPDYADAHGNLGEALREKGQLDEAIAECREAIRLKKGSPQAHLGLGNALKDKGQLDDAIAELREAIRLKPDLAEAHANLGNALKDNGQLDEAVAEDREAIRLNPRLAAAHNNLGYALADKGQLDEAIAAYRQAIQLEPDFAAAHSNLGNALSDNGHLDEAYTEYRESIRLKQDDAGVHSNLGTLLWATGQEDEGIAEFREAIRLKPDLAEAHTNLGNALRGKGQLDQAIKEQREAVRLKKNYPLAHLNLGLDLNVKGQNDEAISEYREAIRLNKDYAEAHAALGNVLRDMGQVDEAIAECREAIRLKQDYAEAHATLGSALADKRRVDEAIAEFREAIRLNQDYAEAHADLGNALTDKCQLDEAITECREAIRLKPNLTKAHFCLGRAFQAKDQVEEAIAEYRQAIRIKNDNVEAHLNLANVLLGKGQSGEATAEYREAIRLKPNFVEARLNLGAVLVDKGELDEGIAEDREAIRLKPYMAEAHGNLGNALTNNGQLDEAIAEFREAIRLKKDFVEAHSALGSLLLDKGYLDEAIAECREAIRLEKDSAGAHETLGAALREKGELSEAITELREAIRLKKDFVEAHANLGLALKTKGQLDEAVVVLNEAVRLAPNGAESNNALAWLLATCANAKLRDPGRAVELAKKAITLAPTSVIIWNTLGVARYRAGDWKESAVALEKSVEIRKGGDAFDWYFLAMANWRLNHQEEARKWYDQAVAWTDKNKPQDEELLRFRAEAVELLKVKK